MQTRFTKKSKSIIDNRVSKLFHEKDFDDSSNGFDRRKDKKF